MSIPLVLRNQNLIILSLLFNTFVHHNEAFYAQPIKKVLRLVHVNFNDISGFYIK